MTPKIGSSKLPGKYIVGAFYYGGVYEHFLLRNPTITGNTDFTGRSIKCCSGNLRLRSLLPSSGPTDGKSVADGKSFKEPAAPTKPKLSKQGLYIFSLIS